jgi:hypothetical protein
MKEPFPESLPDPVGTTKRVLRFAVFVCVLISFAWFLAGEANVLWNFRGGNPSQPAPLPNPAQEIVDARDAAQYDKALQLAASGIGSHPDIPQIRELSDALQRDFKPAFDLHCVRHGKPLREGSAGDDCQELTPADEFYVTVTLPEVPDLPDASRRYYAYLFLVDSDGSWRVLLPNKTNPNPLLPFTYQVPDNYGKLHPSNTPGAENLFLIVAWWPIPALEDLLDKLAAETDPERVRDLGRQIDERLRLEQAKPTALKGLKTGTLEFEDSGKH